jgi:hypothetical protein
VRRRAVLVVPEGQRPHPRRPYGRGVSSVSRASEPRRGLSPLGGVSLIKSRTCRRFAAQVASVSLCRVGKKSYIDPNLRRAKNLDMTIVEITGGSCAQRAV